MGHMSHIAKYERGGIGSVAGIMPWVIKNQEDGTLPIEEMEYITNIAPNEHVVPIQAISLESSMNNCQGKVLRMDYI